MRYPPGTIIVASDRKYIVDKNGSYRVYEYLPNHWSYNVLLYARAVQAR